MTVKNKPTCTWVKSNYFILKARIGSMKPYKKYPRVPENAANVNSGYFSSSKVPIVPYSKSSSSSTSPDIFSTSSSLTLFRSSSSPLFEP